MQLSLRHTEHMLLMSFQHLYNKQIQKQQLAEAAAMLLKDQLQQQQQKQQQREEAEQH